ncbi:hypothetical protein ABPG72_015274 [Tetrahymena utriculariae]
MSVGIFEYTEQLFIVEFYNFRIIQFNVLLLASVNSLCGNYDGQMYHIPEDMSCEIYKKQIWMNHVLTELKIDGTLKSLDKPTFTSNSKNQYSEKMEFLKLETHLLFQIIMLFQKKSEIKINSSFKTSPKLLRKQQPQSQIFKMKNKYILWKVQKIFQKLELIQVDFQTKTRQRQCGKNLKRKIQTIQLEISFELCDPGQLLNLSSNQCVQSCSKDQDKLEQLKGGLTEQIQCGYGCKVCKNQQSCLECFEPFKADRGKCLDTCNQRDFYSNGQCQQCFEECQNCESKYSCNILESSKIDKVGKKCIDGEINFLGICQKFSYQCKTCVAESLLDCTSCAENYSFYKNLCLNISESVVSRNEQCKPGYGYQKTLKECIKCQDNCLECTNQTRIRGSKGMICNTCNQQSYANGEDLFQKAINVLQVILICSTNVKNAMKHATQKQVALDLLAFNAINVMQDIIETAQQMSVCLVVKDVKNANKIKTIVHTACPQNNPIQFNNKCLEESPSECFYECQEGYFADFQGECSPCDKYKCKTFVQAPFKCTSCNKNEFLIDHNCYEKCPEEGYYIDKSADDFQCRKYLETCRICQKSKDYLDSVICTQCKLALVLVNGQFEAKSPKGSYETHLNNQLTCLACNNKCSQCIEKEDFCIKCSEGYFLLNNQYLSRCPPGFYKDVTKNQCCLKCDEGCQECRDIPSNCSKCEKGSFIFEQNQCLPSCSLNTYPDIQRICQPCSQYCTQGCVRPALEDCLQQIQVIVQKNDEALYVTIFLQVGIILALTCIYICQLIKMYQQINNNNTQDQYKRQNSDTLTLAQLDSIKTR